MHKADTIADVLRFRREQLGISAQDLATSIGLHPHVIGEWEEGKRTPRLYSAIEWAAALGLCLELRESRP